MRCAPSSAAHGIKFLEPTEYSEELSTFLAGYFQREIAPVLTPLAFDPGHPFPHISNRSKNLAVAVKHEGRTKFARIKLPPVLPRFLQLPAKFTGGGVAFVFIEDVVCANVEALFPGTSIKSAHVFRVIRDTDMVIEEDEADDLLETIDQGLRQLRHGAPSLLQVEERMPRRVLDILVENFEIDDEVLVRTSHRLGFGDWMELVGLHRPELKDVGFAPRIVWGRNDVDEVFELVRHRDFMLHHPFDSFVSVETFSEGGGPRPSRCDDQAHAISHRPRFAAHRPARGSGRGRQAGRGARSSSRRASTSATTSPGRPGSKPRACTSSTASST